jgi:toxic protein SymE
VRKLKVGRKYFPRKPGYKIYPEIRLAGRWLEEFGFTCNEKVEVYCSYGSISIKKSKE